jgi:hypothetical protein
MIRPPPIPHPTPTEAESATLAREIDARFDRGSGPVRSLDPTGEEVAPDAPYERNGLSLGSKVARPSYRIVCDGWFGKLGGG